MNGMLSGNHGVARAVDDRWGLAREPRDPWAAGVLWSSSQSYGMSANLGSMSGGGWGSWATPGVGGGMAQAEVSITDEIGAVLFDFLRSAAAAGVRLILEYSPYAQSTWFQWDVEDRGWDRGFFIDALG